ncbi:MAG TPA: DNA repair protein RadC [Feifaniaceae bacterium]|nr:DNA repair protein RadC [Feifaniaceae bacterium]
MHEGHRERLRERYSNTGIGAFTEHELLELLLTYAIPRRNTNELAHRLIDRFGSLAAVLSAEVAELTNIEGIGERAAVFLRLLGDSAAFHAEAANRQKQRMRILSPADAANYALDLMRNERYESVYAVSLDNSMRLLHAERLTTGSLSEAPLYPRRVVESALMHRAAAILLLHNHPSGDPTPSSSDAEATKAVQKALNSIDIRLYDHLVVGEGGVYSFSRGGMIPAGRG